MDCLTKDLRELYEIAKGYQQNQAPYPCYSTGRTDGFYEGVRYVFDKIAEHSNDPLTLEEMRGMDGEAVWNDTAKKWAIVDIYSQFGPRAIIQGGRWRPIDDRYYRHRPEGEKIGGNRQ